MPLKEFLLGVSEILVGLSPTAMCVEKLLPEALVSTWVIATWKAELGNTIGRLLPYWNGNLREVSSARPRAALTLFKKSSPMPLFS